MATKAPAKAAPAKSATKTAVAVKSAGGLVSIQERMKNQIAAMAERVSPPSGDNISLKGKKFVLPDGVSTEGPIRMVVVDFISIDRKSTRLNSSHLRLSRMPSSA